MSEVSGGDGVGVENRSAQAGRAMNPDEFGMLMAERERSPEKRQPRRPEDFAGRTLGGILLAFVAMSLALHTYVPISQVLQHEPRVSYNGTYLWMQPIFLVFGLIYSIFGTRASTVLGPTTRPSRWACLIALACLVISLAYTHFFEQFLASHGYVIHGTSFLGL